MHKLLAISLFLAAGTAFASSAPSRPDATPDTGRGGFSSSVTDPDAFDRWDADGNGMIDAKEWENAELEDDFERWDTNRDGYVGREERDRAIIARGG